MPPWNMYLLALNLKMKPDISSEKLARQVRNKDSDTTHFHLKISVWYVVNNKTKKVYNIHSNSYNEVMNTFFFFRPYKLCTTNSLFSTCKNNDFKCTTFLKGISK